MGSDFLPLLILLLKSAVDSVSLLSLLPSIRLMILPRNPELLSSFFLLVMFVRALMLLRLDEQAWVKKSSCFLRYAFSRSSDSLILFNISILHCWLWMAMRSCCWETWSCCSDLEDALLRMGNLSMLELPTFAYLRSKSIFMLAVELARCIQIFGDCDNISNLSLNPAHNIIKIHFYYQMKNDVGWISAAVLVAAKIIICNNYI